MGVPDPYDGLLEHIHLYRTYNNIYSFVCLSESKTIKLTNLNAALEALRAVYYRGNRCE